MRIFTTLNTTCFTLFLAYFLKEIVHELETGDISGFHHTLVYSSLISVFHKLYPARYSGPRMEHVLRNTVLTALEVENPTLFTVYKLLTNHTYRKQIVETLTDPIQ
jgi:hypothetical protein